MSKANLDLTKEIKIYPLILDGHKSSALWSLCRGMDHVGSGKISFTMIEMTSILGVQERTIFKYMSSNLFFHKNEICNKPGRDYSNYLFAQDKHIYHVNKDGEMVYTLYYKSIHQVKEILCINEDVLRYAYVSPLDLHKDRKRVLATEICGQINQKAATFATKREETKKKTRRPLLNPELVFNNSSSYDKSTLKKVDGVKLHTNKVLLVDTDKVNVAVASQSLIAEQMGRHRTTINRRLSKSKIERKTVYTTNDELKRSIGTYFSVHKKVPYFITDEGECIMNINSIPYKRSANLVESVYEIGTKVVNKVKTVVTETFDPKVWEMKVKYG